MKATALLFSELQDLKRLCPAGVRYSLADALFVSAWQRVLGGDDWAEIAEQTATQAILYVLFPGVDGTFFQAAGLKQAEVLEVCTNAFERTTKDRLPTPTIERLRKQLSQVVTQLNGARTQVQSNGKPAALPDCLTRLRGQPRAGATHPEHPRLVLLPAESHADHCLLTAVYAALTSDRYGADVGAAFVCGLAHHLHNAYLPDCGWAGELALEPYLIQSISNCRTTALQDFQPSLREQVREVLLHHESIATPEGEAISTGDVLDRVLDVKWRVRAAAVTDAKVLGDLDLVHPGPLKDFQTDLLNETGLWSTR